MIITLFSYGVIWALVGAMCYANLPTRYTLGHTVPTIQYLAIAKLKKIDPESNTLLTKEIQASELFSESPLLIMVVRRPGCAFCRKQATILNSMRNTLQSRGIRPIAIFHETMGLEEFWPDLKWDLYFDGEKHFYGPMHAQRWLPLWSGYLRFTTYWNMYKALKAGFRGNLKGEGRLLGGIYLINKDKLVFSHLEREWGDEVNPNELIKALKKINNMNKITIYTTSTCPYCIRAKALLKKKNLTYEEINVEEEAARMQMIEKTGGKRSVPQIFIGEQHIGGYDDLHALEKAGKLN